MNITDYVKSLKGVTSKDEVVTALESVNQDLTSKTLPILATSAAAFKTIKLKSPEAIGYDEKYRNAFHLGRNAGMLVDIDSRMKVVLTNLDFVRQAIQKTLPDTVTAAAIDYRSAVLMQLVDHASFLSRFLRRLVETVTIYETESVGMYEDYQQNNLTRGEAAWVDKKFPYFIDVLLAFSESPAEFKKKFDSIPAVLVDGNASDTISVFGRVKMDPYRMGFIPVRLNPFFHVGKWIAEFQAWRHKEAQEDLVRIQRRILLLEEALQGKSNPKIEKELEILRDKSEGLIYRINKTEEELAE